MKRKVLIFTILLLIGGILFCAMYSFPKVIDTSYPAVEFRTGDASSAQRTTVHIKGSLHRPLFRNQVFHGRITVEKYDYSKYEMSDIVFYPEIRNGWGNITYYDWKPSGFAFGSIWKKGSFDSVKILLYEPTGPEAGGGMSKNLQIIAPAEDYESAAELSAKVYSTNQ
ncbi:hypothetical protein [Paenibacillus borealis]|uniref:Uncharacterized protein n=1 Tax=Paenibacillus borealis TaxID=160799 RepID=A0A089LL21_PAEBO|nr:hypothetical protein [Paenibacillus borealis]AIQ61597.1 hypothetical protein PBOR_35360 [Paenibacillus borealis]